MAFSGTNRYVFKAYQYALGNGEIKNTNYQTNINAYIADNNFWYVNSNVKDSYNANFGSFKLSYSVKGLNGEAMRNYTRLVPTRLKLEDVTVTSFNADTQLTSDISYERITSTPASAKIFSTENNKSWVTKDLDWSLDALSDKNTEQYFRTEYNFSTNYDKGEYDAYGLNQTMLDENVISLSANKLELTNEKGNPNAMDNGAAGLLLTYSDDEHIGDKEIPMVYIEFPKLFNSNNNYLSVEWHEDGVLKVE